MASTNYYSWLYWSFYHCACLINILCTLPKYCLYYHCSLTLNNDQIYLYTVMTSPPKEGTLLSHTTTDWHTSFNTTIQLITEAGTKALKSNRSQSTDHYYAIRPLWEFSSHKVNRSGNPKQGALQSTDNAWVSHCSAQTTIKDAVTTHNTGPWKAHHF